MFRRFLLIGYKLIILQLILLSIVAGASVFISDWRGFISVLLGGGAWIIPSLYFVRKLFKSNMCDAQALLKNFLCGEAIKLLLSAGLIIFIVFFFSIKTGAFLSGYIATIAASFFTPFWLSPRYVDAVKNDS
ncbi:MAG: ATP synthase subunit I [bacterium]